MEKLRKIVYYSRGAYTIFLPGEAENTTFAIGRRKQKWNFRPARKKNYYNINETIVEKVAN